MCVNVCYTSMTSDLKKKNLDINNIFTQRVWAVITYCTWYTLLTLYWCQASFQQLPEMSTIECSIAPLPSKKEKKKFTGYTILQLEARLSSKSEYAHFHRGNRYKFLLPKKNWGCLFLFPVVWWSGPLKNSQIIVLWNV